MNKKIVALVVAGTVALVSQAQTFAQDNSGAGNGPRPGRKGPPHAEFGTMLKGILQKYDVNADQQLDATEWAALVGDIDAGKVAPPGPRMGAGGPGHMPAEILEKYDLNKDGVLDETERAALKQDVADGKLQPPPGRHMGGGGGMHFPPEVVQTYDVNKDGQLDETERAALKQDIDSGKLQLPEPPRAPRAPRPPRHELGQ